MTDRELMQQALEALELHAEQYPHMQKGYTVDAITALRERLAQPEQEPVAWIDAFGNVFPLGAQRGPKHLNEPMKPLYTTPPQRKPLTDEQIWDEVKAADLDWQTGWSLDEDASNRYITFARAIEAAHGIKENT